MVQGRERGRQGCGPLARYLRFPRETTPTHDDTGSCLHCARALEHPRWEDYDYEPLDPVNNRFFWLGDGNTIADKVPGSDRRSPSLFVNETADEFCYRSMVFRSRRGGYPTTAVDEEDSQSMISYNLFEYASLDNCKNLHLVIHWLLKNLKEGKKGSTNCHLIITIRTFASENTKLQNIHCNTVLISFG